MVGPYACRLLFGDIGQELRRARDLGSDQAIGDLRAIHAGTVYVVIGSIWTKIWNTSQEIQGIASINKLQSLHRRLLQPDFV